MKKSHLEKSIIFKATFLILIIIFFQPFSLFAKGFDMKNYCRKTHYQNNHTFLQKFPYKNYLQNVSFINFRILQRHRSYLNKKRKIGNEFLYYLGEHFLKIYPTSISQLKSKIKIGESYITPHNKKRVSRRANEIYKIIGYYILGKIARKIEEEIKNGDFDITDADNIALVEQLKNNKIYISVEESRFRKVIRNIKEGHFGYIFDRLFKKTNEIFSSDEVSQLKLYSYRNYYTIKKDYAVNIFRVKKNNNFIGYSIWLKRPYLKAKYFAYKTRRQSVFQRYRRWLQQKKRVVLVTSGGFTNSYKQPEGLTVENGNIVNAVLMPERDGLVIIQKSGGMRVVDLRREVVKLPIGFGKNLALSPKKSLIDYSKLIKWCQKYKATLFQTQLLAYSDELLINIKKAKPQLRERRILTLARDKKNNQLHHIIFHITANSNLAVLSKEIYDMLTKRGKKIEAMLNLDVGSYNILNVFDHKSRLLPALNAPISIRSATNLIVYTR
jgi:hypothetical protein